MLRMRALRRKVRAQQTKVDRARAKGVVLGLSPDQIAGMGSCAGMTAKQARNQLLSMAHWEPRKIIATFGGAA
jgi:hypothetical protein